MNYFITLLVINAIYYTIIIQIFKTIINNNFIFNLLKNNKICYWGFIVLFGLLYCFPLLIIILRVFE